jgi:hypothetical protein
MNPAKKKRYNLIHQPFEEARAYVQSLGLKKLDEWHAWAHSDACPDDIPNDPRATYKGKGWVSLGDWLGTGAIADQEKVFLPFEEARSFVRSRGLKNYQEWGEWVKRPEFPNNIPAQPRWNYRNDGWGGIRDWLGTGPVYNVKIYRPFEEARAYVHSLELKSQNEWWA